MAKITKRARNCTRARLSKNFRQLLSSSHVRGRPHHAGDLAKSLQVVERNLKPGPADLRRDALRFDEVEQAGIGQRNLDLLDRHLVRGALRVVLRHSGEGPGSAVRLKSNVVRAAVLRLLGYGDEENIY